MSSAALATERLTLPYLWLDTLWLQISGTVCNIACKHCFISCGPKVRTHDMLTLDAVAQTLATAEAQGVREIWLTGGEPFLHPDILAVLDASLAVAPVGVLTNGMLIDDALAAQLGERTRNAPYNLEIRVSLDGVDAARNDAVRGRGVFERALAGVRRLAAAGVEPLIAVSLVDATTDDREPLLALLRDNGVARPRVKWIPPFKLGREAGRTEGYQAWDSLSAEDLATEDAPHVLQCGTSRTVTSQGVFPCPILINEPRFRLGDDLAAASRAHPVDHAACVTCWASGFSCSR